MDEITGQSPKGNGKAKKPRATKAKKASEYQNALREAVTLGVAILVVDNKAKANLLRSWGIPATYSTEHAEFWRGANAVILNDDGSHERVNSIAASLQNTASIRMLELSCDVTHWAKAGGTVEQLRDLIEQAPYWLPPMDQATSADGFDDDKNEAKRKEDDLLENLSKQRPGGRIRPPAQAGGQATRRLSGRH
jgi:hypothetical protein